MDFGFTLTASEMPVAEDTYAPLAEGWYTAIISNVELKDTKAGTGKYLSVRYDITGPTSQGRVVFANITVVNPSEKAEKIGREQIGKIMSILKLKEAGNSDVFVGHAIGIKLSIRRSEEWGDRNEVREYKPADFGEFKATPSPADNQSAPPWKR